MHVLELRDKFRDRIIQVAAECHIRTVKVFGSTTRGTATEDSDVDLLISLNADADLLDISRFKWKVEEILHKKVDIAFESRLHPSIASQILKEAQEL